MTPVPRVHAHVHGVVQGVGFRWATRAEAERLGLTGWVRNLPDGSVECELEGEPDTVARMLDWLRVGPFGARVDRVDEHAVAPTGATGFEIRHH
ncbi:acylphosphatase [uncultured Schumannella sp.]|uniref:acylphosphatase n=1 Tax=uncultured Schumannella sp. TaxID=1195956 RepID=UPI0025ED01D9|nr:acylphosphatase [uncultured Schumannella sp.]